MPTTSNQKVFTIRINGVTESIKQVDALSDALQFLEKTAERVSKAMSSVQGGSGGTYRYGRPLSAQTQSINNTALREQDALLKSIQKTEQKIAQARSEDYQSLLASRDILKDIQKQQNTRGARERLGINDYANTLDGISAKLSDIKTVLRSTDLGSSQFKELTQEANRLNEALKQAEAEYGQYGRNVGNYKSAAEGFKQFTYEVNGVVRTFGSARQAVRELSMELDSLGAKGMRGSALYKGIQNARDQINALREDSNSTSAALDDFTDAITSFVSIGSIGSGLSALFGFDDSVIERSIQRLVALQNILQGIEQLNLQMRRGELFGNYFNGLFNWVNRLTERLFGVRKEMEKVADTAKSVGNVNVNAQGGTNVQGGSNATVNNAMVQATAEAAASMQKVADNTKKANSEMSNMGKTTAEVSGELVGAERTSERLADEIKGLDKSKAYVKAVNSVIDLNDATAEATKKTKELDEALKKAFPNDYDSPATAFSGKVMSFQEAFEAVEKEKDAIKKGLDELDGAASQAIGNYTNLANQAVTRTNIWTRAVNMLSTAFKTLKGAMQSIVSGILIGAAITIITVALDQLIQLIGKGINSLMDWVKGDADLVDANKLVESSIKSLNAEMERQNSLLAADYISGRITLEQYHAKAIQNTTAAIREQIAAFRDLQRQEKGDTSDNLNGLSGSNGRRGQDIATTWGLDVVVNDLDELEKKWKEFSEAVKADKDILSYSGKGLSDWFKSLFVTVGDTKDELTNLGQVAIGEFINRYEHAMQTMVTDTKSGEAEISNLIEWMNSSEMMRSVLFNIDQYVPEGAFRDRIQGMIDSLNGLQAKLSLSGGARTAEQIERSAQLAVNAMKDGLQKSLAQLDLEERRALSSTTLTEQDRLNVQKDYANRRAALRKQESDRIKSENDAAAREARQVEENIARLRIEAMRDGFQKQLAELRLEWNQRRQEAVDSGRRVREQLELINRVYNQRELNMMIEHYREMQDVQRQFEERRRQVQQQTQSNYITASSNNNELSLNATRFDAPNAPSGDTLEARLASRREFYQKMLKEQEAYNKKALLIQKTQSEAELQEQQRSEEERYRDMVGNYEGTFIQDALKQYQEAGGMGDFSALDKSLQQWFDTLRDNLQKGLVTQKEYNDAVNNENAKAYLEGNQSFEQYMANLEQEKQTHDNAMLAMNKAYNSQVNADNQQAQIEDERSRTQYYQSMVNDLSQALGSMRQTMSSGVTVENSLGFINMGATKRNIEDLKTQLSQGMAEVNSLLAQATDDFNKHKIDFSQYDQIRQRLAALGKTFSDTDKNLSDTADMLFQQQMQKIMSWVNFVNQQAQGMLNSLFTMIDNGYQDELDKLNDFYDDYLDELQDAYDKQEEIVSEASDNIDSIESELDTARGGRRQRLIDALNAEVAKQREAAAEQRRIQEEQDKAEEQREKEQEKIEAARAKAQKTRDIAQATVNTALAVGNAIATVRPWWAALVQAAVAASMGAAQVAIISSTKYANGGLLQGPSHSQGGIKVGNSGIEVEGNEFVTNKKTTMANLPLMEYINSKRRKLTMEDFIDFYTDPKTTKAAKGNLNKVFADGGQVPLMTNKATVDQSLVAAFNKYAERPTVVSVVDIIKRQDQVNRVRTLAGLA